MKKALSLILALIMVFALATTAFAENVVGTRGQNGDSTDGVDAANASKNYSVSIDVSTNSTISKYAVDVTYNSDPIALGGAVLTWDVNDMRYEITGDAEALSSLTRDIVVTNYSDKAIRVNVTVSKAHDDDGLNIGVTGDAQREVDGASPGVGGAIGTATVETFTVSVSLEDGKSWSDVATYYTNLDPDAASQTAATVSLTIAPVP